jgi:hypothetical protein
LKAKLHVAIDLGQDQDLILSARQHAPYSCSENRGMP